MTRKKMLDVVHTYVTWLTPNLSLLGLIFCKWQREHS